MVDLYGAQLENCRDKKPERILCLLRGSCETSLCESIEIAEPESKCSEPELIAFYMMLFEALY